MSGGFCTFGPFRPKFGESVYKIKKLKKLERELVRISKGCDGEGTSGDCYVLAALADHKLCGHEH